MTTNAGAGRARNDQGITLVELLVAMMLTSLIALMAISLFMSTNNSAKIAQSIDGGTRQASNGMNEVARMIRAATADPVANPLPGGVTSDPAIVSAAANSITALRVTPSRMPASSGGVRS